MATRPVFIPSVEYPYFKEISIDFKYHRGLSLSQYQKCIDSLHSAFCSVYPNSKMLEISSKSRDSLGRALSAFNLPLSLSHGITTVECAYQGSKVFERGGPYLDLIERGDSRSAKLDARLSSSGDLIGFFWNGVFLNASSQNDFYNSLYITALKENKRLSLELMEYNAFTDIIYNPKKGVACQARAAAMFIERTKTGLTDPPLSWL